jgi:hypothetical protein
VEERVHRTGSELVSVAIKFLNHAKTEHRLPICMVENMKAHKSRVQVVILGIQGPPF